jgi:hypothetical protein
LEPLVDAPGIIYFIPVPPIGENIPRNLLDCQTCDGMMRGPSIKRLMGNIGPHSGVIAAEQMKPYRHGWRRASVFIATLALALNVVLGAFCVCHAEDSDSLPASICSHSGDHHTDGKSHTPAGQPDDDLCCKCCGTIALNFSGAPPAFQVPVLVEWRRGPVFVVLDRVLPKSPRHIIESPRGPPLA